MLAHLICHHRNKYIFTLLLHIKVKHTIYGTLKSEREIEINAKLCISPEVSLSQFKFMINGSDSSHKSNSHYRRPGSKRVKILYKYLEKNFEGYLITSFIIFNHFLKNFNVCLP